FFGIHLALMLCNRVNIYGFLRTWKGWVKYHYFNPEEPNTQQLSRDTGGEMVVIERLLKEYKDRLRFAHPCVMDRQCQNCSASVTCDPKGKAPFPVPKPGYCAVEGGQCILKCKAGDPVCKGGAGKVGICSREHYASSDEGECEYSH
ncbi:hypothetical protein CYMTET_53045, partial [Cymbomonas tetramitiformis]